MSATCPFCQHPHNYSSTGICRNCQARVLIAERYRLDSIIGSGGFGKVFRAIDIENNTLYAVKLIRIESDDSYYAIKNEINILTAATNGFSFVPKFHGLHYYANKAYIVMQYISGNTLDQYVIGYWSPERIRRFLNTNLQYLQILHQTGIIHRDIKPSNIKRTNDGYYVLLDFGIAKKDANTITPFRGSGTSGYMPYEQMMSEPTTPQSDLYSLGATAYCLLTNHPPPDAMSRVEGIAIQSISQIIPSIPEDLNIAIMWMLRSDPINRPQSADDVLQYLNPPKSLKSLRSDPLVNPLAAAPIILAILLLLFLVARPSVVRDDAEAKLVNRIDMGRLVFSSNRSGQFDLYISNDRNSEIVNLTGSPEDEFAPTWSKTGDYLVYVAQMGESVYRIGRLDLETGQRMLLTPAIPDINYGTPTPSPDGEYIAYNSGPEGNYDIYLMKKDGSEVRPIATNPGIDYAPTWLDNDRIVYISQKGTSWQIVELRLSSGVTRMIYETDAEKRILSASPDVTKLAFAMKNGSTFDIYTVSVLDGSSTQITGDLADDYYPSWSPTGDHIAFMSTRGFNKGQLTSLYVVSLTPLALSFE